MPLTSNIAQHIQEAFTKGNWSEVSLTDTLAGVNYTDATTVTTGSLNSIAALLYHLTYYNEIIFERLRGNIISINNSNGFDLPAIENEEDWQQLQQRCTDSVNSLVNAVKKFPEEKLFDSIIPGYPTVYKTLHGIAEHAHYHLGQILVLKKLLKNNPS